MASAPSARCSRCLGATAFHGPSAAVIARGTPSRGPHAATSSAVSMRRRRGHLPERAAPRGCPRAGRGAAPRARAASGHRRGEPMKTPIRISCSTGRAWSTRRRASRRPGRSRAERGAQRRRMHALEEGPQPQQAERADQRQRRAEQQEQRRQQRRQAGRSAARVIRSPRRASGTWPAPPSRRSRAGRSPARPRSSACCPARCRRSAAASWR